jgi:leucyl/phenylalanyl-tRNA---protein transferase
VSASEVPYPPIEPLRTHVRFPDPSRPGTRDVLAVGCDFSTGTLLEAYRHGIFPWPHGEAKDGEEPTVLWFSPDPRAIYPLEGAPHWSRSLRRTLRKCPYRVSLDEDFEGVMRMCGATRGESTWIIPELVKGYSELHRLGWAHSVEVWEGRELVGGIYGVSIGGLFAGESMFHTRTDCSKIAFATLVERLRAAGFVLFDVQVMNPHLESLGCVEVRRKDYLTRLGSALRRTTRLA